jgi:hypothetical protein
MRNRNEKSDQPRPPWTVAFSRARGYDSADGVFQVKGAGPFLRAYDGYERGPKVLDAAIALCLRNQVPESHHSSTGDFAARHEYQYDFLDGGLEIYAGNSVAGWGEPAHTALVRGFRAFRGSRKSSATGNPGYSKGKPLRLGQLQIRELSHRRPDHRSTAANPWFTRTLAALACRAGRERGQLGTGAETPSPPCRSAPGVS